MALEADLRKEARMTKMREALLTTLKVGGFMTVAVMAPNVAALIGKTINKSHSNSMRSALRRLQIKGLVQWKHGRAQITAKGLRYFDQHDLVIRRPLRWDKKWRIVIFDIQEKRKVHRNILRDTLKRIGFHPLQRSVWIFPYDCEELIALLKAKYRIGSEVSYIIADKVENDRKLRNHFQL